METVFLVGVDAETAAAVRQGLAADHRLVDLDWHGTLGSIEEYRSSLGAIVLGAALDNPLTCAQQIHAVDKDVMVCILCGASARAGLERTLRFTPLGGLVVCHAVEERLALADKLRTGVTLAVRRRGYHNALRAIDTQLQKIGPRPQRAQYVDRLLDSAPVGVAIADKRGKILDWNRMAGVILDRTQEKALGTSLFALFPDEGGERLSALLGDCTTLNQPLAARVLTRRKADGALQYVETIVSPIIGEEMEALLIFEDVTAKKRAEEQQQLAEKVFTHSSEGILITDKDNRILSVNPAFTGITGYTAADVIGQDPRLLSSGRHDAAFYGQMWDALQNEGSWAGEIWDRRKNGEIYPKWLSINAVYDEKSGELTHFVAIFSDITERKRSAERIHYLAYHDALTELPNRFSLHAQLPQMFAGAQRQGKGVAVLFLDLDRFKTINDSLGHHVGDEVLVEAARRIRRTVRESDTVSRIGGDEFVIVLPEISHAKFVADIAAKILACFADPVIVGGYSLYSTSSIGIGLFPDDGEDVDTLLKNADTALYHAKAQGRNNFQFFSNEMNLAATERLLLENQLRRALGRDELDLHYQPQVEIGTGAIVGVEALARWLPAGRDPVSPAKFIPIAEECGLIAELGAWVMRKACREAKRWQDLGLPPLRMSVNLSALQLRDQALPERVEAILRQTGFAPDLLELEITESAIMAQPMEAIGILDRLKAMGIVLTIDDFGTGYSSLAYLKLLPIDRMKIDQSFIAEIEHSHNDAAIATSAIALAHSLGLKAVAEGVETRAQLEWLAVHGCDETQGYYWSRPLPAAAAAELIRDGLQALPK